MILADTSVWVDHLRRGNPRLQHLLLDEQILCHPFVIGELACGRIRNRSAVLSLLKTLSRAQTLGEEEALAFIETHRLVGSGLGWIDVQLLASTLLAHASLWTLDRQLVHAAARLGVASAVH